MIIVYFSVFHSFQRVKFWWLGGGCHMNVVFVNLLNQPFLDMQRNRNTFQWQLLNADRVYFSRQVYEMHSGYICQWRIVWNVHTGYFKKCQWQLHEMYSLSTTDIYMKYTDMYSRTYILSNLHPFQILWETLIGWSFDIYIYM